MLFLSVSRIDGELELSLTTRHPHPSMSSWSWLFALDEQTDIEHLIHRPDQRDSPRELTVSPSGTDVHIRARSKLHIVERRRALLMDSAGRVHEVALAKARHQVRLTLGRGGTPRLEHSLELLDDEGNAHPLWQGLACPALANALRSYVQTPIELVAMATDQEHQTSRLSTAATATLASFFSSTATERAELEAGMRRRREADVDVDNALYLRGLLRGALGRYAPVVEHGPGAVRAALHHTMGEAQLTVTTTTKPTTLTLTSTLPSAPPTSLSMTRADGLGDVIRNWRDVRCGDDDVDRAFIIEGDAALAADVARRAGDILLALGRQASVRVEAAALQATTTTTDLHPGAHASVALRLAELWERLLH